MHNKTVMVWMFLWLLIGANITQSMVLVQEGETQCAIVMGDDDGINCPTTHERSDSSRKVSEGLMKIAAQELADHLNDIAWIGDPAKQVKVVKGVKDVRQAHTPSRILLGSAAIREYELEAEAATLPCMSYIYRVVGNDLLIFGSSTKGTANGVFGFLQDELGVRWFGPGDLFRVIPEMKTIAAGPLDRRVDPDLYSRFTVYDIEHPAGLWALRMRIAERTEGAIPFVIHAHNFAKMFPVESYGKSPELYAQRGNRRDLDPKRFGLCYSNPEVARIAAEQAIEWFRGGKHRHSFSLGINDSIAYCECKDCAKLQPERLFRGRRVASDMYIHFVNDVARRVRVEFPDRYLGLLAYNDVAAPPLGGLESNVFAVLTTDIAEYFDPVYRAQDQKIIDDWQAKGIKLGMYYYTSLAKMVPAYFPRMLAAELKARKARGFVSLYCESAPGWPWMGPMPYAQVRLSWDTGLSIDALLDDYFKKLFGPAAPPMSALYALFEEIHTRPRSGGFLFEHYNFAQFRPYTAADLAKMRALIAEAHGAIKGLGTGPLGRDGKEGQRVAYVSSGLKVFLDMLEGILIARELEGLTFEADDVAAQDTLRKLESLRTLTERHEVLYRETILADPSQGNRFLNDTCTPVREQWKKYLASVTIPTLAGLFRVRENLDKRVRQRIEAQIAFYTCDPLGRAAFGVESGQATLGDNLANNPGFETVDDAGKPRDWKTIGERGEGLVIDVLDYSEPDKLFGVRSGRIRGAKDRGMYLLTVPDIVAGASYLIEVDAKMQLPEARRDLPSGVVILRIQWHGKDAGWVRDGVHTYEVKLDTLNEWKHLRVFAIAPPGVNEAKVFLRVEKMRADDEVALFDNLSVRKIITLTKTNKIEP